jgi:hypothetical protein
MIMTIATNLAIRCRCPATMKYPPQKHQEISIVVLYALSMLNSLIRDHVRDNNTHDKRRRYRTMPMLSRPWTEHPRRNHSKDATTMLSEKKNRVRSIGTHLSSGTPLKLPANTKSKNNASKLTKPPRIETSRSNSVSDMSPRPGTGPVPPARSIALGAAICLIDRRSRPRCKNGGLSGAKDDQADAMADPLAPAPHPDLEPPGHPQFTCTDEASAQLP